MIMECSICQETIEKHVDPKGKVYWDQGNNAEPVNDGRCCDKCNMTVVIPARLGRIIKK
jgi:hypothetical protein